MTVFGPIVTGADVEDAVEATLKLWVATYIAEMERRTGRTHGALPVPRSYSTTNRFNRKPEDQLPSVVIVSPGISDRPQRRGDGTLSASWRVGVAVVCSAVDQEASNELAKLYGAAIRLLLVQQPSLGGFAAGVELVSEGYDDVPTDYLPIGAAVEVDIDVRVDAISDALTGPTEPDPSEDGPADFPTVETVDIDIERRSLE